MPAHPPIEELNPAALPPVVGQYFYQSVTQVSALGFGEPTFLLMPNPAPNILIYASLQRHEQTGDKALVTAFFHNKDVPSLHTAYLEYSTRFENGLLFDTSNSTELQSFATDATDVKSYLPSVKETEHLYKVHRFLISQKGLGDTKAVLPPETAAPYIERVFVEGYEKQARLGRFFYDKPIDAYRPTLVGAYRMMWGLLWPVTSYRNWRIRQEQARLLRESGA